MSRILLSPMSHFLFSPMAWGLLLALLLLLTWRRLPRLLRALGITMGIFLLLLCAPLGANALVHVVESLTPDGARCTARDDGPIVVLSGGFEREPRDIDDYAAMNPETWKRVRGAVELWRKRGTGELWIAGGGPYRIKESAMQARLAADWKVPVSALRIDTRSTTTWESAFVLRTMLPQRIRLVTSAVHLPRSLIAFRTAGFDACAYASDSDYLPPGGLGYFLPQVSAIEKAETAIYEVIGLIEYRLRAARTKPVVASPKN